MDFEKTKNINVNIFNKGTYLESFNRKNQMVQEIFTFTDLDFSDNPGQNSFAKMISLVFYKILTCKMTATSPHPPESMLHKTFSIPATCAVINTDFGGWGR